MRHHFKQSRTAANADEAVIQQLSAPLLNDMIGRRLRRHYEELEQQAVPDRFAMLLDALDQAAPASRKERRC